MGFSPANLLFFLWAMTTPISGVVVDEAGRPVADAAVRLSLSSPYAMWGFEGGTIEARTSQEGRFRVERVRTGRILKVVVTRTGFAPSLRTISVPELGSVPPFRITLRQGRAVFGTVVDAEGHPADGVQVELARSRAVSQSEFEAGPPDQGLHQTTTGSDGRFTLPDLPAGHFDLSALGPGFRSPLAGPLRVEPGTEPLDLGTFTLERTGVLKGWVHDPEGLPVPEAEVWVRSREKSSERRPAAVTGADGRFEIPGLPSRGWEGLVVCRKGFVQALAEPPGASREPVEVVLSPTIPLSGKVVDSRGEPVVGIRVAAVSESALRSSRIGLAGEDFCRPELPRSDVEGRFSLDLEEPGWYYLQAPVGEGVLPTMSGPVPVPSDEEVVLTLDAGVPVEGKVVDSEGKPVLGARITTDRARGASGADGSYRLAGVTPGIHFLQAWHPDYSRSSQEVEVPAEGMRLDLVLEPRPRLEIRGRVVGPDGVSVEGALVSTSLGDRTTTDAGGSFLLPLRNDIDGIWLYADKEGYGSVHTELPSPPPVSGVELRLARGLTLTGRLLGLEPGEMAHAVVEVGSPFEVSFPSSVHQAVPDSDGHYRLLDLPPGSWSVRARAGQRMVAESVDLAPDSLETVHDLVFPPLFEVRGQVTSPSGPLPGVEISLSSQDDQRSTPARTGADGTFSVRLENGSYQATASRDGYFDGTEGRAVTVAGGPVEGVDFQLQPGTVLTGRVLGFEPGEGLVRLSAQSPQDRFFHSAMADRQGNYRISGLPPGAWTIEAVFSIPGRLRRTGQGSITLSPGETEAFLDVELTTD
ncbi:MAG TPA: carboxypeptidase-like regulatory domain-containing protein [Thermoanaerobaculia bacterium]|nr:carboxypeptidase-like regulatory domain-containing protein [Thermoanaerobaculia bacterium]